MTTTTLRNHRPTDSVDAETSGDPPSLTTEGFPARALAPDFCSSRDTRVFLTTSPPARVVAPPRSTRGRIHNGHENQEVETCRR
jgi:hypothetical protein